MISVREKAEHTKLNGRKTIPYYQIYMGLWPPTRKISANELHALALEVQILLLVHHGIDRVVLHREPGIVSCRINAHLVGLHMAMRCGNLHGVVSNNLRPWL